MNEDRWTQSEEIPLFGLGTTLLRNRWHLLRWMLTGAAIAAIYAFSRPALYEASASFVPQTQNDPARSGLANLAGQFGVALPAGNATLSPDFYARLLKSRELLTRIARDTFVVQEMGRRRIAFLDLFNVQGATQKRREEKGTTLLMTEIIGSSVVKPTGVVELSVATRWPSASMAIATALVNGVNEFNQHMRQEQAGAERRFVEGRLSVAGSDLRAAEDRLEDFLRTNRQFTSSPDLTFQRDRLQRDVALKQQMFTSLTQSYEEVRIREVRDTPVITVVESPSVPTLPKPRRRVSTVLLGLIVGGVLSGLWLAWSEKLARHREEGSPAANDFVGSLAEVKDEMRGSVRWFKERIQR